MNHNPLLHRIDQAEREGWTVLDLTGQNIKELPEEIGKLTRLNKLDLGSRTDAETGRFSFNHLKTLPESLKQLTRLECLILRGNKLETLPDWLKKTMFSAAF